MGQADKNQLSEEDGLNQCAYGTVPPIRTGCKTVISPAFMRAFVIAISLPTERFEQRVNAFIVDNLSGADDAEARLLHDQIMLIWHVTSPAAHGTPQHVFKRPDAEFLIRVTMAIVEYFSRLLK